MVGTRDVQVLYEGQTAKLPLVVVKGMVLLCWVETGWGQLD